jgi:glycosyltransferase involved in cell wall biosynthesis
VTYEALACGLPVVTTPNAGSVVRDGVEGFVAPVRDSAALADRIEQIVADRSLRDRLSRNARARASEFTWERYGERLVGALQGLNDAV